MSIAYLGLGSNIYPRLIYLYSALNAIEKNVGNIQSVSSIYQTQPWKMPENTAFFYNLCISVKTNLNPEELLNTLLSIEKNLGRTRSADTSKTYESRCIDIDILLYNDEIIQEENLIVPHPYLHERNFVLLPLSEIAGEVEHPVFSKKIKEFLK